MNWNKTGIRWGLKVEKRVMGSRKLFIRGWGKKKKKLLGNPDNGGSGQKGQSLRKKWWCVRAFTWIICDKYNAFTWASKVKNFLCEMKWETLSIVRSVLGKKTKTKKRKTIKEIIQVFLNTLKWKIENSYESRSSQKLIHLSE